MRVIGLSMLGVAVAMLVLARPRDGNVVHWLCGDNRQWVYLMTIVTLIAAGTVISLAG